MAKACLHNGITNPEIYTSNSVSNSPTQLTQNPSPSWNVLCLLGNLLRSLTRISPLKKSILTMRTPDHEVVFRMTRWMRTRTNHVYNARISNLRAIPLLCWAVLFHIYRFHDTLSLHTSFNTESGVPTGLHFQVNRFKRVKSEMFLPTCGSSLKAS